MQVRMSSFPVLATALLCIVLTEAQLHTQTSVSGTRHTKQLTKEDYDARSTMLLNAFALEEAVKNPEVLRDLCRYKVLQLGRYSVWRNRCNNQRPQPIAPSAECRKQLDKCLASAGGVELDPSLGEGFEQSGCWKDFHRCQL